MPFRFHRKRSDDRQPRFERAASTSQSPETSPSDVSRGTRDGSVGSALSVPSSVTSRKVSPHGRKNSEVDHGPIGLHKVHAPENGYQADIVFVHGLGGYSRKTWTKDEDPELFWPSKFLPHESDMGRARIFTFGYNAHFRAAGSVGTSVLDFAKDLLYDLKNSRDEGGAGLEIGNVPIIFVVHSMGGLIVKEAYMQGQNDPEYEHIIKAITAITFLATPHRGSNLAQTLNRVLQTSLITNSKQYISELAKSSFTLQKLNEQFRHIAPRLDIVSFYETKSTSIGSKYARVMVLEKESSVLGYPGETSKALDADHHDVCKYDSPTDPNYIAVRNALNSLVGKIVAAKKAEKPLASKRNELHDLKSMLAINELPDVDYIFFRDQWIQGTNDWILEDDRYCEWLNTNVSESALLWLTGGPAAGKSVLASYIINSIVKDGIPCQYFFIRYGDQKKRSLNLLLRSLAYQISRSFPAFLQKLLRLGEEAIDFESADPRTIWERVFKSILFNMDDMIPLYWVIDGLDEADDPRLLVKLLSGISTSSVSIRVTLVGRYVTEIDKIFQKVPAALHPRSRNIEGHLEDFGRYIRQELNMSGSTDFTKGIVQRVVSGSQNNFLWVRLAVDRLNQCHTQSDVELALEQLPLGMEALYDRMASAIANNPTATDRALALNILQCVTCSLRMLSVAELSQALGVDSSKMLDIQRSVVDLCGGFIVIDNGGNVAMVHQTAREYLLTGDPRPLHVSKMAAHKQLFLSCMRCLMAVGLRTRVKGDHKPVFLDYAASSWSMHLTLTSIDDGQALEVLNKFLTANWVLIWIHIVATSNQLRVLIQASRHLSRYFAKQRHMNLLLNEDGQSVLKRTLIEGWATDFVKILGKFGNILRRNPDSVYKLIPPFCPQTSSIYQLFGNTKEKTLIISGLSTENWDDSLARLTFGAGAYASAICAAGGHIAILVSSGKVLLYDSLTFEEASASPIKHGERLYRMELDSTATTLATYGYRTTKIWEVSTGRCRMSIANLESRPRPIAMLLTDNGNRLTVGMDNRYIYGLDLNEAMPTWELVTELEEPELEGHFLNSANYMTLNKHGTMVAVAYRGHPLSAWEIEGPVHIGHCWRKREAVSRGEVIEAVWHPHYPEVLGLYIEGTVFKWRPYDDDTDEIAAGASRLSISRDGNLFATGDVRGTVKVYTTADFGLLYQLTAEGVVLGIAFSPDLHRFYDIRGYYGNAWEPSALMRFADQQGNYIDNGSETESYAQSSTAMISSAGRIDSITAVAGSSLGRLYCCGTQQGTLRLFDTQRGKLADLHVSKGFLSIEHTSWSSDGRYLCFSDSSKKITVVSITSGVGNADPTTEIKAELSLKTSANGPILQLMFSPDSSLLLVRSSSTILTMLLETGAIAHSLAIDTAASKWIVHPQNPALIVGVGPTAIHILNWSLAIRRFFDHELSIERDPSPASDEPLEHNTLDCVLSTHDKKHLLIQTSSSSSKKKSLVYLETSKLTTTPATTATPTPEPGPTRASQPDNDTDTPITTLTSTPLPKDLTSQISTALALLPRDNLIFLSRTFEICSCRLSFRPRNSTTPPAPARPPALPHATTSPTSTAPSASASAPLPYRASSTTTPSQRPPLKSYNTTSGATTRPSIGASGATTGTMSVKALFSLPGDWISRDCLALCVIWARERSLLCPRNGEVGVVRCVGLV